MCNCVINFCFGSGNKSLNRLLLVQIKMIQSRNFKSKFLLELTLVFFFKQFRDLIASPVDIYLHKALHLAP